MAIDNDNVTEAFRRMRMTQKTNLENSFINKAEVLDDFEKARSGTYANTSENRKLGRVGQQYGETSNKEDEKGGKKGKVEQGSKEYNKFITNAAKEVYDYYSKEDLIDDNNKVYTSVYKFLDSGGDLEWLDSFDQTDLSRVDDPDWPMIQQDILERVKAIENGKSVMKKAKECNLNKAESDMLNEALEKGVVELVPNGSELDEDLVKAVFSDVEFNQQLGIVGDEFDFQKSDIMDAISGYCCGGDSIRFSKTGKEIKEKVISEILPQKKDDYEANLNDANNILTDCGKSPTCPVPSYWLGSMNLDFPLKIYSYEECCYRNDEDSVAAVIAPDSTDNDINIPTSDEEAMARRKYNDAVNIACSTLVDIKACEIIQNNMKDNSSFELSPRQIAVFHFD